MLQGAGDCPRPSVDQPGLLVDLRTKARGANQWYSRGRRADRLRAGLMNLDSVSLVPRSLTMVPSGVAMLPRLAFLARPRVLRVRKLLSCLLKSTLRRGLRYGVLGGVEHTSVLRRCRPHLVVDVGANRGQFALAARAAAPAAKILSFEPPAAPRRAMARVFASDSLHEIRQTALADLAGRASLHISESDDNSSLLRVTPAQIALFPAARQVASQPVDVSTLDIELAKREIPERSLLKLEVQGGELSILHGGRSSVPRLSHVYAELSTVELYADQPLATAIICELRTLGFELCDVYNLVRDRAGRLVHADFLFTGHADDDIPPDTSSSSDVMM